MGGHNSHNKQKDLLFVGLAYDFPDSGGYGGNTTTAEAARKFYKSEVLRERLVSLCPDPYIESFRQILLNDLIILRLMSCNLHLITDKVGQSLFLGNGCFQNLNFRRSV